MTRFVAIQKEARGPRRASRRSPRLNYELFHRVADAKQGTLARLVQRRFEALRAGISVGELAAALEQQQADKIDALFDWESFQRLASEEVARLYTQLVRDGGKAASVILRSGTVAKAADDPPPTDVGFWHIYNAQDERAEEWAAAESSRLITEITEESRAAVRAIMADTLRNRFDYGKNARRIIDVVGLHSRAAAAVDRYRAGLEIQGVQPRRVESLTRTYSERLLKQRAETIARTETIAAVNQGQADYWKQLSAQGMIDSAVALKEWIVTPDDRLCDTCRLMHGQRVGINDLFKTPLGTMVAHPPLHPNCRCAVNLVPDGVKGGR